MSLPSTGPLSRLRDYGTVRRSSGIGHYPRPDAVEVCAQAWGVKFSTARQRMNPAAPDSVWQLAARGTEALASAGHVLRAQSLCRPIFSALQPKPLFVTREAVIDALTLEAHCEGPENEAQAALADWSEGALDSWLRRAEREHAAQGAAIQLVRAYLGKPC